MTPEAQMMRLYPFSQSGTFVSSDLVRRSIELFNGAKGKYVFEEVGRK